MNYDNNIALFHNFIIMFQIVCQNWRMFKNPYSLKFL